MTAASDPESLKRAAGEAAGALVESGMRLGLGTGSTVRYAVEAIARRLAEGTLRDVAGVATSRATEALAAARGLPLIPPGELRGLQLCIDGADEVDPQLNLIKGMGGALLREKLVAGAAERMVVVADSGKLVARMGTLSALPVAVVPFAWQSHVAFLEGLGAWAALRLDEQGEPKLSDDGLYHLDCRFASGIDDPELLEAQLKLRPGIVESGLFLDLATEAIIASPEGLRVLRPA